MIDNQTLFDYENYYFKLHPKAKKKPIAHPYHPSINTWMILQRMAMNTLKQQWKDFIIWYVNYKDYVDKKLDTYEMTFTVYFPTKARHDPDNQSPKFIMDGLTEAGFIIDDDDKHCKSLTLKCDYDKIHPRTEILVRYQGE